MTTPAPEAPSARRLIRSTAIAAGVAALLLVTVVLPAEYGVDPTGAGRVLGLKAMGDIKVALAREAAGQEVVGAAAPSPAATAAAPAPAPAPATAPVPATPAASAPAPVSDSVAKTDVAEVTLRPNEGKEIKLAMRKGARVTFSWSTDSGVVNYDTHADAPGIRYHGYGKGTGARSHDGVLTAAFDGFHGWFWRNRGAAPVVVTLRTSGDYRELKRMP